MGRHELQQVRSRAARVAAPGRVLCYASPSTRIVSIVPCSRLPATMYVACSESMSASGMRARDVVAPHTDRHICSEEPPQRPLELRCWRGERCHLHELPTPCLTDAQAPLCTGSWNLCPSPGCTTSWVLTLNVLSAFQYSRDCDTGDSSSLAPTTMSVGVRTFFTKLIGELLAEGGCFHELHADHTKAPLVIARAGNRFWNHRKLL